MVKTIHFKGSFCSVNVRNEYTLSVLLFARDIVTQTEEEHVEMVANTTLQIE